MFLVIHAVNTASKYFEVIGDVTSTIAVGNYIQVLKSTGNNGIYKLSGVAFSNGYTRLTTTQTIPSAVADGNIAAGVYELKFADATIAGKTSLVIAPWNTDTSTSLKFNGKASLNFGEWQQQNTLRVLENFASSTAPTNPTIGQHWFDFANSVIKVYTASGWSSDVNVEGGLVSFKDPQHPTANTKYFLTAAEPAGKTASGVTLYPAVNPTAGMAMFRIVDASGTVYFEVDYQGKLISLNPLQVTATSDSTFANSVSVNTGGGAANGLNVKNNVVVTTGDVQIDSGKALKNAGGTSVTLDTAVKLKGTATGGGVIVQNTSAAALATFADALITLTVPITGTTSTFTTSNVTGVATIATANVTTLNVSGVSTLSGNATVGGTLGVTGVATFSNRVDVAWAPTVGNDVVNKTYADACDALKVNKAGDTMSGNLNLNGVARVTNALDPVNPQDYVTLNALNNITLNGGTF